MTNFECKKCNTIFPSFSDLSNHLQESNHHMYKCRFCRSWFETTDDLRQHLREVPYYHHSTHRLRSERNRERNRVIREYNLRDAPLSGFQVLHCGYCDESFTDISTNNMPCF